MVSARGLSSLSETERRGDGGREASGEHRPINPSADLLPFPEKFSRSRRSGDKWKRKERGGGGGEAELAGDCRGFSQAEDRSGDLTFWQWAVLRKCRRLLPGGVLSVEEEGTKLEELEAAHLTGLELRFCFLWEYFCLIECLWISRLCFSCVAQTNRCGVRDSAGWGWGGPAGGPPRPHHVECPHAACSSPVRAHWRAPGAQRY
ncbi:PREDICTED: uncharacterized protein LOC105003684 [Bison bison bison]|uniref:Uncharacterized protein LOC105003684 n=1 Tax=Bison bison bison TaxID=43346 RepID=A0A6P3J654_BISBB|nr:PREDICTED: uncharacterized protein LOC105003684 [Bison bison bison]